MKTCPHCGFDLQRRTKRRSVRGDVDPGGKSTGDELVTCPDCERVIDGFSSH